MRAASLTRAAAALACAALLAAGLVSGGNSSMVKSQEGGITPVLVESGYDTGNAIADIVITQAPYSADPTGLIDCTEQVKSAMEALRRLGGGTVFFPAGKYRVTSSLTVPNYVTLRGEWNSPEGSGRDYGTIVIADVASKPDALPGLFRLSGSSGVVGMTVWYPGQLAEAVRPYPYTFEIMGGANSILEHMQFTIANVTLLNSYRGVAASRTPSTGAPVGQKDAHEGLIIENLYGTPLKVGVDSVNESDVGYFKNVEFSPKFWVGAGAAFNAPDEEILRDYLSQHSAGLMLGDLEWSPYYNIRVDGYMTGVHMIKGTRIQPENPIAFMGGFYGLYVTGAKYALIADDLFFRWGMLVTGGRLEGSEFAVANNAPAGYVRLTDVELSGKVAGDRVFSNAAKAPQLPVDTPKLAEPAPILYNAAADFDAPRDGKTEAGPAIQRALDAAGATGGTVYLPAGYYKVSSPLTVPKGVRLSGSSAVCNRDNLGLSAGTAIFCYWDGDAGETSQAFITLGEGAGLTGLRIAYPENNLVLNDGQYSVKAAPYTVRMGGDNAYIVNVGAPGWYRGVDASNTNGCVIKNMPALFFELGVNAENASGLWVENLFSNATVATQSGYHTKFPELFSGAWDWRLSEIWNYYTYTETHTRLVRVKDGDAALMSVFTFCSANVLTADNARVTMNGCGADRMYRKGSVAELSDSTLVMVNQLKYNCPMFASFGKCSISVYGRMNLQTDLADVDYNLTDNQAVRDTPISPQGKYTPVEYPADELFCEELPKRDPLEEILNDLEEL